MTVFYVLLYYVWRQRYHIHGQKAVTFGRLRSVGWPVSDPRA